MSGAQWRQGKCNFSPCFSLLESHSLLSESFLKVSEGPGPHKELKGNLTQKSNVHSRSCCLRLKKCHQSEIIQHLVFKLCAVKVGGNVASIFFPLEKKKLKSNQFKRESQICSISRCGFWLFRVERGRSVVTVSLHTFSF